MTLEPHRINLLKSLKALIQNYLTTLKGQTPQLIMKTNQLWELNQRQCLVAGVDDISAITLLSASHAAYQSVYHIVQHLHVTLAEIADHVSDFEQQCFGLNEQIYQVEEQGCQRSLAKWNALFQTLNVLQTQAKYLELHVRSLSPSLMKISTVKQFKKYLYIVRQYELKFCMALACNTD